MKTCTFKIQKTASSGWGTRTSAISIYRGQVSTVRSGFIFIYISVKDYCTTEHIAIDQCEIQVKQFISIMTDIQNRFIRREPSINRSIERSLDLLPTKIQTETSRNNSPILSNSNGISNTFDLRENKIANQVQSKQFASLENQAYQVL